MDQSFQHHPVLLQESIDALNLHPRSIIVDGTLGGGGHAESILEATAPDGILYGVDQDPDALEASRARLHRFGDRAHLIQGSFRDLAEILQGEGIQQVDGVLLDLGVSSYQLDAPHRGFRFSTTTGEGPLDMRMNPAASRTAADLLAKASAEKLQEWFQCYGELPGSRRLSQTIVEHRRTTPIRTNADLLRVIQEAGIGGGRKHHPATLVFQALRIAVNDEIGALEEGLQAAIEILKPGGRLVVIAYHSIEDRIVKLQFRQEARGCICSPKAPICTCQKKPRLQILTRRPLIPDSDEIQANPRARSARLRVAERIREAA